MALHIWQRTHFLYNFGKRNNRLQREMPMTIRNLLVDDHTVVRKGLRTFLSFDPELEVVGEAADGNQAQRLVRELTPDVVLMDLVMPGMDGITATASIRRELPETEVVALTSVLEDASVVGAVRAGAIGYLLKDTQAEALCQAIKAAARLMQERVSHLGNYMGKLRRNFWAGILTPWTLTRVRSRYQHHLIPEIACNRG
jgi:DNA-binding NarL/FixJ family response regulator